MNNNNILLISETYVKERSAVKVCKYCGIKKDVNEFNLTKTGNTTSKCKLCIKEYHKNYAIDNRESLKNNRNKWITNNLEKYKDSQSKYNKSEKRKLLDKKYYNEHPNALKDYIKNNLEKCRLYRNNYNKERRLNDNLFNLTITLRTRIGSSFKEKGFTKNSKTCKILGCSFKEFKQYIESKFEPWMSWENKGNWNGYPTEINKSWDLDHIIPLSIATTKEEIIKLNHYTNFQPLCSYYNRHIKKDKIYEQ